MSDNRYQTLLDLFERKESVVKDKDSFEIVRRIEEDVFRTIEDIFYPYEVVKTSSHKGSAPDGVIKMGQRVVFYEIMTGLLDPSKAFRIREVMDHALKEIISLSFPGQTFSILIICKNYHPDAIRILQEYSFESRKRHVNPVVITPKVLIVLHELSKVNMKTKDLALSQILDLVGPVSEESVRNAFKSSEAKSGFLETPTGPLRVTLEYGESKVQFEGSFEEVWRSINRFLAEMRPSHMIKAIANLTYRVEIEELVKDLEGIVKISPDGPFIVASTEILNAEEKIALILVGAYTGFRMGMLREESLTTDEIASWTGLALKTVQATSSQMLKERLLTISDTGKRNITTIGIQFVQSKVLPKIRGEIGR